MSNKGDGSDMVHTRTDRVAKRHGVRMHEWRLVNDVVRWCGHGVAIGVFGAPGLQA
jgi:hypothetical protein